MGQFGREGCRAVIDHLKRERSKVRRLRALGRIASIRRSLAVVSLVELIREFPESRSLIENVVRPKPSLIAPLFKRAFAGEPLVVRAFCAGLAWLIPLPRPGLPDTSASMLMRAFADHSRLVRAASLRATLKIGPSLAIHLIHNAPPDPESPVRPYPALTLSRIFHKHNLKHLFHQTLDACRRWQMEVVLALQSAYGLAVLRFLHPLCRRIGPDADATSPSCCLRRSYRAGQRPRTSHFSMRLPTRPA